LSEALRIAPDFTIFGFAHRLTTFKYKLFFDGLRQAGLPQ